MLLKFGELCKAALMGKVGSRSSKQCNDNPISDKKYKILNAQSPVGYNNDQVWLRYWGWRLLKILKLNFNQDYTVAEVWSIFLKGVVM